MILSQLIAFQIDPDILVAIEEAYFNPTSKSSFTSNLSNVRQEAQKLTEKQISLQDVKNFYKENPKIQITRSSRRRFPRVPIYAEAPNKVWACDTAYMKELSAKNDNQGFLIVLVDVFSKMVYARPCKNIRAPTVLAILQSIIEEADAKPEVLFSDLGTEFRNGTMQKFLTENGIKPIYSRDPSVKCSIAERYIRYVIDFYFYILFQTMFHMLFYRTLKTRIFKWVAGSGNFDYTTFLQQLVCSLNQQPNRSLPDRLSPIQVQEHIPRVYQHLYGDRWKKNSHLRFTFELDQKVRISMRATEFSKSYKFDKWSSVIYRITKRIPSRPPRYKVCDDSTGSELLGSFYKQELLTVPESSKSQTVYQVKRIVKRRVNSASGSTEYLVQYVGPDNRHLEWITQSQYDGGSII